ncbi:MAG: hypothetical protein D6701_07380 [Gemmatimonadetes bacterium]|nr:MAG: hypothetical protein D6701_07380 [Gemmatimonadota bacterium]
MSMKKVTWIIVLAGALAQPLSAQSIGERLTLHGFLTQAYADASDYPIFGIPQEGTSDLRAAALQFGYRMSDDDKFVVQLSHTRLGTSQLASLEGDVELDWGFYQRRFGDASLRVGKVPMPRGLFNEVRDVGTILPFYRAPKTVYGEGVETIDGAALSYQVNAGDWGIELGAYGGGFEIAGQTTLESGLIAFESRLTSAYGGQVIVNLPVPGVRVGATGVKASISESEETYSPATDGFYIWTASFDAALDRVSLTAEYEKAHQENVVDYKAYYVRGGVRLAEGLWLNAQAEYNTNTLLAPAPVAGTDIDGIRDYAVGASYAIHPGLVLKAEYHDFAGYELDVPVDVFGPKADDTYFIFSVATAF